MANNTHNYTLNPHAHWTISDSGRSAYSDWVRDSVRRFSCAPSSYLQALAEQRLEETLEANRPITTRVNTVGPNPITHNTIGNATPDPTQDRPPVANAIHNTNDNNNMWEELTTRQRVVSINPDGDTVTLRPMYSYNSDVQAFSNAYTTCDRSDILEREAEIRDKYTKEIIGEFKEAMPQYSGIPQTLQVFKEFIAKQGLADVTDNENQLIIELANIALINVLKRNNSLTKEVKDYKARTQRTLDAMDVLRKDKDNMRLEYERAHIRTMLSHEEAMREKDNEIKHLKQMLTNRMTQTSPDGPNRVSDSETINPTIGPGDYLGPQVTWEPHLRVRSNTGTNNTSTLQWKTRPYWE